MAWCYTMPATPHRGTCFILTKVVARRVRLLTSQMDKASRGRRQALARGHTPGAKQGLEPRLCDHHLCLLESSTLARSRAALHPALGLSWGPEPAAPAPPHQDSLPHPGSGPQALGCSLLTLGKRRRRQCRGGQAPPDLGAPQGEGAELPRCLVHTQAGDPSSASGTPSAPQVASVSSITTLSTSQLDTPACQGDVSSEIHRYPPLKSGF